MEAMSHMQVPEDVPFDERLFESNGLLKQYWQNSVKGRSEYQNLLTQRSAEEDDARNQTFKLFETVSETKDIKDIAPEIVSEVWAPEESRDDVLAGPEWPMQIDILPTPKQLGPTLEAKSIPAWGWAIIGVLIGLVAFMILFVF